MQALSRDAALVVDAGGNDLLRIDRKGNIKVLAVFPDEVVPTANIKSLAGLPARPPRSARCPTAIPAQPVPTSIAIDKHGYIYVGELKGFPAPAGESNIWRISPRANGARCGTSPDCVKVFDGGFTSIIDLAFGPDGLLYVTELDEGSWAALEIFGTPAGGTINACNVKARRLPRSGRRLAGADRHRVRPRGALWSTQHSLTPGEGEVVKVRDRRPSWWQHPKFGATEPRARLTQAARSMRNAILFVLIGLAAGFAVLRLLPGGAPDAPLASPAPPAAAALRAPSMSRRPYPPRPRNRSRSRRQPSSTAWR